MTPELPPGGRKGLRFKRGRFLAALRWAERATWRLIRWPSTPPAKRSEGKWRCSVTAHSTLVHPSSLFDHSGS